MSSNPMAWEGGVNPRIKQVPQAASCLMPMGVTSENVAEKFGVDRKTQVCMSEDQQKGGRETAASLTGCQLAGWLSMFFL